MHCHSFWPSAVFFTPAPVVITAKAGIQESNAGVVKGFRFTSARIRPTEMLPLLLFPLRCLQQASGNVLHKPLDSGFRRNDDRALMTMRQESYTPALIKSFQPALGKPE